MPTTTPVRPVRMSPGGCSCRAMFVMLRASVAPIGSMKMPSKASTDSSGCLGLITASSGPTTVGPDTIRMAPITAARIGVTSNTKYVRSVAPTPVIAAPTVTSPSTGRRAPPCRRRKSSFIDSSKRSTATAIETSGKRSSPRIASGFTQPSTGPTSRPTISSRMIDGMRVALPSSWPSTPNRTIAAMPPVNASSMETSWRAHRTFGPMGGWTQTEGSGSARHASRDAMHGDGATAVARDRPEGRPTGRVQRRRTRRGLSAGRLAFRRGASVTGLLLRARRGAGRSRPGRGWRAR